MSASSSMSTIYSFIPTSPLQVLNLVPIPIPIISTSPENPPPRTPTFPTSLLILTSHFPKLGIGTGNPGVFQGYPYPYPRKPLPMFKGTGFEGYGYGFSPKITQKIST